MLRQMEIFRAVMLTGSMNGAAKLLFVSQPVVSRIVSHTEQTLGMDPRYSQPPGHVPARGRFLKVSPEAWCP